MVVPGCPGVGNDGTLTPFDLRQHASDAASEVYDRWLRAALSSAGARTTVEGARTQAFQEGAGAGITAALPDRRQRRSGRARHVARRRRLGARSTWLATGAALAVPRHSLAAWDLPMAALQDDRQPIASCEAYRFMRGAGLATSATSSRFKLLLSLRPSRKVLVRESQQPCLVVASDAQVEQGT